MRGRGAIASIFRLPACQRNSSIHCKRQARGSFPGRHSTPFLRLNPRPIRRRSTRRNIRESTENSAKFTGPRLVRLFSSAGQELVPRADGNRMKRVNDVRGWGDRWDDQTRGGAPVAFTIDPTRDLPVPAKRDHPLGERAAACSHRRSARKSSGRNTSGCCASVSGSLRHSCRR